MSQPEIPSDATTNPSERSKRDSLLLLADVREVGGRPIGSLRIRNLSATGLMAECERLMVEGDRVVLSLRGVGDVAASVSWWQGGRVGLAFDESIDPLVVRRTQAAVKQAAGDRYKLPRYAAGVRRPG